MTMNGEHLSAGARKILNLIAEGRNYEQILKLNEEFTYLDIFNAASEALNLDNPSDSNNLDRFSEIRQYHPRAYERWSPEEDARLVESFRAGKEPQFIAEDHQRQQSAVLSRLRKLGFLEA